MSASGSKQAKKQQVKRVVKLKQAHRLQQSMSERIDPENPLRDLRFDILALKYPDLKKHLVYRAHSQLPQLNWENPTALGALNAALFKEYFDIEWNLPTGFLMPRLPARVNFLLAVKRAFRAISGKPAPNKLFEVCSPV